MKNRIGRNSGPFPFNWWRPTEGTIKDWNALVQDAKYREKRMYACLKRYNEAIDQAAEIAKIQEAVKEVLTHESALRRDS